MTPHAQEIIDALKNGADAQSDDNLRELIEAVDNGDFEYVKALLECGVHPDRKYYDPDLWDRYSGTCPLGWAEDHLDIAKLLIQYGAKPDKLSFEYNEIGRAHV